MMDDLANADFAEAEGNLEAFIAPYAPLLTNYVLARGGQDAAVETNPIRLEMKDEPGFDAPLSVFMIYMKFDTDQTLIVRQLKYDNFPGTLEQAEATLLGVAQATVFGGQHALDTNFKNMRWQRPYYTTFVIDNPGWKFYWGQDRRHEAIRFLKHKDAPGNFQTYEDENHSFFDAEPGIPLGNGDAFRCRNYHRDAVGPILTADQTVKYCFEIYLQSPFKVSLAGQDTHITVLIDPDGQNQGPRT